MEFPYSTEDLLYKNIFVSPEDLEDLTHEEKVEFISRYEKILENQKEEEKKPEFSTEKITSYRRRAFLVDSKDRDTRIYQDANAFEYQLPKKMYNIASIRLLSSIFPNSDYVVKEINNRIYWTIDDVSDTDVRYATIKPGNYTLSQLETELNVEMNIAKKLITDEAITTERFEVSIDSQKNLVKFSLFNSTLLDSYNPLQTVGKTIRVNYPNHGLSSGDQVYISGAVSFAGLRESDLNGNKIISVIDTNTFSYTLPFTPSGDILGGGNMVYVNNPLKFKFMWKEYTDTMSDILGFSGENSGEIIPEYYERKLIQEKTIDNLSSRAIDLSEDGKYHIILNNRIYTSNNYGGNLQLVNELPDLNWNLVKISYNGNYRMALSFNITKELWVSENFGIWYKKHVFTEDVQDYYISGDGKIHSRRIGAGISGMYSQTSLDGGATWTDNSINGVRITSQYSCALSLDGKYIAWTGLEGVYISSDYGQTWSYTFIQSYGSYNLIEMSKDGRYLSVSNSLDDINPSYLCFSSNYGQTWSIRNVPVSGSIYIQMDYNASVIALSKGSQNNFFYVSYDQGLSWSVNPYFTELGFWSFFTLSPKGNFYITVKLNINNFISSTFFLNLDQTENLETNSYEISSYTLGSNTTQIQIKDKNLYELILLTKSESVSDLIPDLKKIVMNSNGQYQIAISSSKYYLSSDYGQSFISSSISEYTDVAISNNGQYILLATGGSGNHNILLSEDYGQTWNTTLALGLDDSIEKVSVSGDGKTRIVSSSTTISASVKIWQESNPFWSDIILSYSGMITGIAINDDGKYRVISGLRTIFNYNYLNNTWLEKEIENGLILDTGEIRDIDMSNNGQYLSIVYASLTFSFPPTSVYTMKIFNSQNFGQNFSNSYEEEIFLNNSLRLGIRVAGEGKLQFMTSNNISLVSFTFGSSWFDNNISSIQYLAVSDDLRYISYFFNERIYRWQYIPSGHIFQSGDQVLIKGSFVNVIDSDIYSITVDKKLATLTLTDIVQSNMLTILFKDHEFVSNDINKEVFLFNVRGAGDGLLGGISPDNQINSLALKIKRIIDEDKFLVECLGYADEMVKGGGNSVKISSYRNGFATIQTNELSENEVYKPVNINGVPYVYLCSPELEGTIENKMNINDAFAIISMSEKPGNVIFDSFVDNAKIYYDSPLPSLDKIKFVIRNPDGSLYNFRGADYSFTLEIIELIDVFKNANISSQRGDTYDFRTLYQGITKN